jgi:hypothetical protein
MCGSVYKMVENDLRQPWKGKQMQNGGTTYKLEK